MREIILEGLGGQGPRIAGDCMVYAAFLEGKYAQAFPCYGPGRRSGVVTIFYRLDDRPIRRKCTFLEADCFMIMHEYLLKAFTSKGSMLPVAAGLSPEGPYLVRADDSVLRSIASAGGTGLEAVRLKEGGVIIANTTLKPEEIRVDQKVHPSKIATLDANVISEKIYGRRPIPIVNTIMMGAFARVTNWLKLDSVIAAIRRQWPSAADLNSNAAKMGYEAAEVLELR
jgi:pyruvate ferredoxin oxidoreductase gamma subunit